MGPSLRPPYPHSPHLQYRPPAQRGSLERAVADGARVIGLIDGVFHQSLAVSPAEVRKAARSGARLYGGASIGALRACECPDAMQGIGEVWDSFARGVLTDDDEVAMTFMPDTFATVAFPLVQVRETLRLAERLYPTCRTQLAEFLEAVRRRPFQERTLSTLHACAAPLLRCGLSWAKFESWLTHTEFDVKRRDALQVIEAVSRESVEDSEGK